VSHFAAAVVRSSDRWAATELDLAGAADVEDVADRLRDVDPDADLSLLFVEAEDAYLVILRLDQGEDLRVFGSDSAFAEESRIGSLLLGDIEEPALEIDAVAAEDDADGAATPADPDVDPVGDPELLADLKVPAAKLLELCSREGLLPSDVTSEVCGVLGCVDEVDELRAA